MKHVKSYNEYLLLREGRNAVPELSVTDENVDHILAIAHPSYVPLMGKSRNAQRAFIRKKVLRPLGELTFPCAVYRIFMVQPNELRWNRLGESWSFDMQSVLHFGSGLGVRDGGLREMSFTIICAKVDASRIDWDETLKRFIGNSTDLFPQIVYPENELVIPKASKSMFRDIKVLRTDEDWDEIQAFV